jgi:hypothetical protein
MNYQLSTATIECLTRYLEQQNQAREMYTSKGCGFADKAELCDWYTNDIRPVVVTQSTKSLAGSPLAVEALEMSLHALPWQQQQQVLADIARATARNDDADLTPQQIRWLDRE